MHWIHLAVFPDASLSILRLDDGILNTFPNLTTLWLAFTDLAFSSYRSLLADLANLFTTISRRNTITDIFLQLKITIPNTNNLEAPAREPWSLIDDILGSKPDFPTLYEVCIELQFVVATSFTEEGSERWHEFSGEVEYFLGLAMPKLLKRPNLHFTGTGSITEDFE